MKIFLSLILLCFVFIFSILSMFSCRHDAIVPLKEVCFEQQILPILATSCAGSDCHGNNSKNHIKVTSYDLLMQSGVIQAGQPFKSRLYMAVRSVNNPLVNHMPPHKRLTDDQLRDIYVWILQGANHTTCLPPKCDTCSTSCDSNNVKYKPTVQSIISTYCGACHGVGSTIPLTVDSTAVYILASNGFLQTQVINRSGSNPMPKAGSLPLPNCQLAQLRNWIKNVAPPPLTCDSTNVKYKPTVQSIISTYCGVCHGVGSNIPLTTDSNAVYILATSGKLQELVIKRSGSTPMPPASSSLLPNCQIAQLKNWIQSASLTCDSTNVKYNPTVQTIISVFCLSCHGANSDNPLTTFSSVQNIALDGSLQRHVINRTGENPMPPSGKLPNCQIAQLKNWINNGAPQKKK